ncbi:MAG: glycoside hydrolase family 95 protein [Anditalea sp.]
MKQLILLVAFFINLPIFAQQDLQLWYTSPAKEWNDALPIGNGRLGAMVFGYYDREIIQLNEESLWAGSKINNNNTKSYDHLPEIQQAIFNNEFKKVLEMADEYMVGTPPRVRSYQPLGNLIIDYHWKGQPKDYKRTLTLNDGISRTEYTINGNKVVQEAYVSAPQDVVIVSISADLPLDNEILLSREKDIQEISNSEGVVYYNGQINDEESLLEGPGGMHMKFSVAMKIIAVDGQATKILNDSTAGFEIKGAKNIVIAITGATDYNLEKLDYDRTIDPLKICLKKLNQASQLTPATLRDIHKKDHRNMFDRVSLHLGKDVNRHLPTDERLIRIQKGEMDKGMMVLYYQYGRYLLMGSSRPPGRLPANLQGIWNQDYKAAWNSDFHTNINLQMNYWPAQTGNLPETVVLLAEFMKHLTVPGASTAKEMYNARGWTLHHLTDVYGRTGVADGVWGISPMNGPWMTFPLFEHYNFTGDAEYLKRTAYPVIKGSVQFVLDFLIKSPEGYLVSNPSHSPENAFFVPGSDRKEQSQLSYAATIDVQIINGLFNNFIQAAEKLKVDGNFVEKVSKAQEQLPPVKISSNGTIQEWIQDYEEVEPEHRHMSHLLGLYPLNLITPKDPAMYEAANKTIERRLAHGGGHVGWSRAWIINFYARLLDGENALKHVQGLLANCTLNNLMNNYPPFQIDGNFGGSAGIAEMLVQSQNGELHLLPAIPSDWQEGKIKGMRARGGFTVDLAWESGNLVKLTVHADQAGPYQIRYKDQLVQRNLKRGKNDLSSDPQLMGSK